jgi:hypothetical protein
MATRQPAHSDPSYEEQVAAARANLERHIAEHHREVARLRAEFGDPDNAWRRFVRETFDRDALIATYEEYAADPAGWLDQDPDAGDG